MQTPQQTFTPQPYPQQQSYTPDAYTPQPTQQQQAEPPKAKASASNSKLTMFLADCASIGCLKGFQLFELYLRGKEELLLRVYNELPKSKLNHVYTAETLAKSHGKVFLNARMQKIMFEKNVILQPASPCDRELEKDKSKTAFLIAGYARYERPYVWLRSNHERFVKMKPEQKVSGDDPMKLEAVKAWKNVDVKPWDLIEEILGICFMTAPDNPFAVDHQYYDKLSLHDSVLQTGAMINFLRKIYLKRPAYSDLLFEDIKILQMRHFMEMMTLAKEIA